MFQDLSKLLVLLCLLQDTKTLPYSFIGNLCSVACNIASTVDVDIYVASVHTSLGNYVAM